MLISLNKSQPRTSLGPQGQRVALSMASLSWKQIFGIVQRGAGTELAHTKQWGQWEPRLSIPTHFNLAVQANSQDPTPQLSYPFSVQVALQISLWLFLPTPGPNSFLAYTILNPREGPFLFVFLIFQVRMLTLWGKHACISWECKASLHYWWCVCCC